MKNSCKFEIKSDMQRGSMMSNIINFIIHMKPNDIYINIIEINSISKG